MKTIVMKDDEVSKEDQTSYKLSRIDRTNQVDVADSHNAYDVSMDFMLDVLKMGL